jgi:type IV pilus assembly protein PilE
MVSPTPGRGGGPSAAPHGLTLIELMIALTLVGLLTAWALPHYSQPLRQSRRVDAQLALQALAQQLERHYTRHQTYAGAVLDATVVARLAPHYTLGHAGPPQPHGFALAAVPVGAQSADPCQTLTLNHLGQRGPERAGCWH